MSSNLCQVCQLHEFKYKCPKCLKKTCSLVCSKAHKVSDNCSGVAHDAVCYIPNDTIKDADDEKHENNYLVQRDFNFLSNLKRELELQKTDGKQKNKRVLQSHSNRENAALKRSRTDAECNRVIRRGVNCLLLPRGMQRSSLNRSKWDKTLDLFVWTIEWIICTPDKGEDEFRHISHRIKETESILNGMSNIVFEKCCSTFHIIKEDSIDAEDPIELGKQSKIDLLLKNGLKFYTKQFPYNTTSIMDSKELIILEPLQKCIGEIFRNKTVIEYPTIYIAQNESDLPAGLKVVDAIEPEINEVRTDLTSMKRNSTNVDEQIVDKQPEIGSSQYPVQQVIEEKQAEPTSPNATKDIIEDANDEESDDYDPAASIIH